MALSLTSQPGTLSFAKNPAIFLLNSDYDGAKGVRSTFTCDLTDRLATNDTITILYTEPDDTTETIVFTAKAVYDDENELPDNSFAGTNSEYWNLVVSRLQAHHRIAPFFLVTLTGNVEITIQERTAAAGWDIELTTDSGFAVADFAAVASTIPANYRVLFEVYCEATYNGGDYSLAAQLQGVPDDATGDLYFDISSVLAAHCRATRAEPLVPAWGTLTPAAADNIRRYYVRYTEEYGSPAVAQDWSYSGGIKKAMDGGVSQALFAEGDFLGAMDETDAFLTWMPDGKKLGLEQPEFLAWYNHTGNTRTVYLRVVWYDVTDGAASSPTDYFTPGLSVAAGDVALFPVWPELFGLDAEADAYKYTVQVGYMNISFEELSQERTYYIDREYYESERNVAYLNSFGLPECWRCTGEWGKRLKVDRRTGEKPLLPGYNELASDRFQYDRLWDNEIIYRTGYLRKDEAEVLQEMLIAGEVYDVSEQGYIPLQITSNSFRVTDTRQDLHSYEFTAQPRMDMKNYSKKKLSSLFSEAWLDEFGQPWFDAFTIAWEVP